MGLLGRRGRIGFLRAGFSKEGVCPPCLAFDGMMVGCTSRCTCRGDTEEVFRPRGFVSLEVFLLVTVVCDFCKFKDKYQLEICGENNNGLTN